MILFRVNRADERLIAKIAKRAHIMVQEANGVDSMTRQHHRMNVTAAHANGDPLDLAALLDADDFNFAHDVFGIDKHICRETAAMQNFFLPRFSKKQKAAA